MKISLIGAGNVANSIAPKLVKHGHNICQVFNRRITTARKLSKKVNATAIKDIKLLDKKIELLLIMVSDNAISEIAHQLESKFKNTNCIIAHTSGSISSKELMGFKNHGVFYPLQTFKNIKEKDWDQIPILYTGNSVKVKRKLKSLSESLEMNSVLKTDKQRKAIHLSAVILNNFINHLFCLNDEWLQKNKTNLQLLIPLINKTIMNAAEENACTIQTGPARRKDHEVINEHLNNLVDFPQLQLLYRIFSESIQMKYS